MCDAFFFETKKLSQMSDKEWEQVCDGCGLCCMVKIEDGESGEIYNTSVSCKLLDIETCRCSDYNNRLAKAPMCTRLTLKNLPQMTWLPETCAYKRLNAGLPLPPWHYLLTNDINSVHQAGISAKWFAQSEEFVHPDQLEDFVIVTHEE